MSADWQRLPLGRLVNIRKGQVDPRDTDITGLPLIGPNHVESGTGRLVDVVPTAGEQAAESGKYRVRRGEIVYSKIRPELRKATLAPFDGLCSADMYPLSARDGLHARFLLHVLLSDEFSKRVVLESDRVAMPKVNRQRLAAIPVWVPPISEQHRIADFLDDRCAAIDAAIEKKERMEAIQQQRLLARIDALVRGRTNGERPMRAIDGLFWLRTVPDTWRVERNAALFDERDRRGQPDLPVMSVSLASGVEPRDFASDRIQPKMSDFAQYKVARQGDIVFNKMRMWQGAVGVAPCDGLVSPDYTVLRPRRGVVSDYFAAVFKTAAYNCEVGRYSHGIAMDRNRIYWAEFKAIRSPVPPEDEQREIAASVDAARSETKRVIAALQRSIATLREYRTALITAAVTGKIDVSRAGTGAELPA